MKRAIFLAAAVVLPCTAIAQPADYRITELTPACDRWDMVRGSVENLKHGGRTLSLGCAPVPNGYEVSLIQRNGDVSQVDFCTSEGCLRRWVLTSVLGPNGV